MDQLIWRACLLSQLAVPSRPIQISARPEVQLGQVLAVNNKRPAGLELARFRLVHSAADPLVSDFNVCSFLDAASSARLPAKVSWPESLIFLSAEHTQLGAF